MTNYRYKSEKQRLQGDAEIMSKLNLFDKVDVDYSRRNIEAGESFGRKFYDLFGDQSKWINVDLRHYDKIPSRFQIKSVVEFLRNKGKAELLRYKRKIGKLATLIEAVEPNEFLEIVDIAGTDLYKLKEIINLLQSHLELVGHDALKVLIEVRGVYKMNYEFILAAAQIISTLCEQKGNATCLRILEAKELYRGSLNKLGAAGQFLRNNPEGDLLSFMRNLPVGYRQK